MPSLNPYLNFDGNCEEAFVLYRSIFGGEFSSLQRMSEAPDRVPSDPDADRILHVSLPLGPGQVLMGSDRPASIGEATFGDSVALSVSLADAADARRVFEDLSAGGQVQMPFEKQFWGTDFGMCIDRFGIYWMVTIDPTD